MSAETQASILKLLDSIKNYNPKKIYIAYSGGIDSSVLLHSCAYLWDKKLINLPLAAWHINHKISKNADIWEKHCIRETDKLNIPIKVNSIKKQTKKGESTEVFARRMRYEIWSNEMQNGEVLLQAHHRDDQAETILLKLARGSSNLTGIPKTRYLEHTQKELADGENISNKPLLARPFLELAKDIIRDYATMNNIAYVEDDSNQDNSYERNFIRNEIISRLREKWPGVTGSLAASADRLSGYDEILRREEGKLYREFIVTGEVPFEEDPLINLAKINQPRESAHSGQSANPNNNSRDKELISSSFSRINQVAKLPLWQFQLLLRRWLKELDLPPPNAIALQDLRRQVQSKNSILVAWQEGEIRSYKKRLYAMAPLNLTKPKQINASGLIARTKQKAQVIKLSCGILHIGNARGQAHSPSGYSINLDLAALENKPDKLSIGFRRGGEKIKFIDEGPTHDLKKLFQEYSILPWLRTYLPLIYLDDDLIAVPGIGCRKEYQVKHRGKFLLFVWLPHK